MEYIEPFRISTNVFGDDRGDFSPLILNKLLPDFKVVQTNTVTSTQAYTFRGLHWQEPPYDQGKLLRCVFGNIIDFVVDIRQDSPFYGQSYAFALTDKNDWVYVPHGFAHGYLTLPHNLGNTYPTIVEYLIDNDYNKDSERGMYLTDDIINIIKQEIPSLGDLKMKDRDKNWPKLDDIKTNFIYPKFDEDVDEQ